MPVGAFRFRAPDEPWGGGCENLPPISKKEGVDEVGRQRSSVTYVTGFDSATELPSSNLAGHALGRTRLERSNLMGWRTRCRLPGGGVHCKETPV